MASWFQIILFLQLWKNWWNLHTLVQGLMLMLNCVLQALEWLNLSFPWFFAVLKCNIKFTHICSKSHHFYSILPHVCFFVLHTKWNVKTFLFPLFSKLATDQYKFGTEINWILLFNHSCNKVVIELCVMQFWSEIILVSFMVHTILKRS